MSVDMREQLLQDLIISQAQVIEVLESMADVQDWQPEPVEWSFRYIAAHLANVEKKVHLRRVQRIASGENPRLSLYVTTAAGFQDLDLRDSLRQWVQTRRELIHFVGQLSERQLEYTGLHEKVGPITLMETLQEILVQDQGNFRHVCRLIDEYNEEAQ
jgi:hypothetical protein